MFANITIYRRLAVQEGESRNLSKRFVGDAMGHPSLNVRRIYATRDWDTIVDHVCPNANSGDLQVDRGITVTVYCTTIIYNPGQQLVQFQVSS